MRERSIRSCLATPSEGLRSIRVRPAYDVVQMAESQLRQVFAHLAGQESEKVHQVFAAAQETLAQFFILGGYSHRAGIHVALAHHHATQHDQGRSGKAEFLGSEHGHRHDVASGLELAVGLQAHLPAQAVAHQGLLRLGKPHFGGHSRIADGAGRRGSRAAFGTRDDDPVGLGLGYSGRNGAHPALRNQFDS